MSPGVNSQLWHYFEPCETDVFNGLNNGCHEFHDSTLIYVCTHSLEDADKKNAADIQAEARKREQELKELIGQFNDLKSDMPLVYTLREDFIRSMNSVDHNISGLDQKLDQVLRLMTSFGKEG